MIPRNGVVARVHLRKDPWPDGEWEGRRTGFQRVGNGWALLDKGVRERKGGRPHQLLTKLLPAPAAWRRPPSQPAERGWGRGRGVVKWKVAEPGNPEVWPVRQPLNVNGQLKAGIVDKYRLLF